MGNCKNFCPKQKNITPNPDKDKVEDDRFPEREEKFMQNQHFENPDDLCQRSIIFGALLNLETIGTYKLKLYLCNDRKGEQFEFIGETSYLNGINIIFNEATFFSYRFEKIQNLKVVVLKTEEKEITNIVISLKKIIVKKEGLIIDLFTSNNKKFGQLKLQIKKSEIKTRSIFDIKIRIQAQNLIGKEYYYLINHFQNESNFLPAYKCKDFTPTQTNQVIERPFTIVTEALCSSNDPNQKIQFGLYYRFIPGKVVKVGTLDFNMGNLRRRPEIEENILYNKKKIGEIRIKYLETPLKTFKDYLQEDLEINLAIGIDYTKSNGSPKDPESLHYIGGNGINDYEIAIRSCGRIVGNYDKDQKFPVYGFGGIPNGRKNLKNCFPLNFSDNPEIETLENIIKTYRESFENIELYGPTFFAPLIRKVLDDIREERRDDLYTILMILTDGAIDDFQETKNIIVEASKYPLSIIIIGLGNGDFENMVELDGDEVPVTNEKGEQWSRHIVQFVKFETYKEQCLKINENEDNLKELSGSALADDVLKEIPGQVVEYFNYIQQKENSPNW